MGNKTRCSILIQGGMLDGAFANGFRVTADCGGESYLDFLEYSERTESAVVVARIRVSDEFLSAIRDHLTESISEKIVCLPT